MRRRYHESAVERAAAAFPAVVLTGPRQCGKTTLLRAMFPDHRYANLDHPDLRARGRRSGRLPA